MHLDGLIINKFMMVIFFKDLCSKCDEMVITHRKSATGSEMSDLLFPSPSEFNNMTG